MRISNSNNLSLFKKSSLSIAITTLLVACGGEVQKTNSSPELAVDSATSNSKLQTRTHTDDSLATPLALSDAFGSGFNNNTSTTTTTTTITTNGIIGNAGGFGFGGSIASIIGNVGGFGFGGFGAFASFFAGTLPTTPPNGVILPPPGLGGGLPPGQGGIPPGLGGTPPGLGGGTPPGGGVGNPGSPVPNPGVGTPPGLGGTPPGNGAGNPNPGSPVPNPGAGTPPGLGGTPPGNGAGNPNPGSPVPNPGVGTPPGLGGTPPGNGTGNPSTPTPNPGGGTGTPPIGGIGSPPGLGGALPPGQGGGIPPGLIPGSLPALPSGSITFNNNSNSNVNVNINNNVNINDNSQGNSITSFNPNPNVTANESNLNGVDPSLANSGLDFVFLSSSNATNSLISPLAVSTVETACVGGGLMTRTLDDVDPVGLSTGDMRTTAYTDCVRNPGGNIVLNGSRGFIADQMEGVPFVDPNWTMQTTMFQENFTRENTAAAVSRVVNGSTTTGIVVVDTTISQSATGTGSVSRTNDTGTKVSDHAFNLAFDWDTAAQTYTWEFGVTAQVTLADLTTSSVSAETSQIFSGAIGAAPTSGSLTVSYASAGVTTGIVTATAQPDGTVLVETDSDADGVVDTSIVEPTWDNVLWQIFNSNI